MKSEVERHSLTPLQ